MMQPAVCIMRFPRSSDGDDDIMLPLAGERGVAADKVWA